MDRNAFAVEALAEAVRGIVVVDRRKTADRVKADDRRAEGFGIRDTEDEEAA
jgi:hypothetical protein